MATSSEKLSPWRGKLQQIKKRLAEIEGEIGRYVKALGQGKLSIARLEAQIGALEADQESASSEQFDDRQRKDK